jgi:hypothetical protein
MSCGESLCSSRQLARIIEPDSDQKTAKEMHCQKNSRDNKTAIELFIAGVRGWEAELRRVFAEKMET